jgi:hypothetical protein
MGATLPTGVTWQHLETFLFATIWEKVKNSWPLGKKPETLLTLNAQDSLFPSPITETYQTQNANRKLQRLRNPGVDR